MYLSEKEQFGFIYEWCVVYVVYIYKCWVLLISNFWYISNKLDDKAKKCSHAQ